MRQYVVRETFLRPAEQSRESTELPAVLIDNLRRLLARHRSQHGQGNLFIPIRRMQYQAIVEEDEIVFVDGQGGYAHQDGVGGRLIQIAWHPQPMRERTALTGPVPCDVCYYALNLQDIQRRLVTELGPVLARYQERDRPPTAGDCQVIPFRR